MPPDIIPAPRPPSPQVEIIRKAVNAAHALGLVVSTVPDLGVHCTSTHAPRWEVEQRVQVLSPLGAVLLTLQPEIPDADAALAHVLGVNRLWILGFDEGQSGVKDPLIQDEPAARLFGEGFKEGIEFRVLMHRRQGVPVARQPDQTRQTDTPRSLLIQALREMTLAQRLETFADQLHEMAATLPADIAEDLRHVEHVLRETAAELRAPCGEG